MICKREFGYSGDKRVFIYDITNKNNAKISVTQAACALVSVVMPDKNGNYDDIVMGYDNPDEYIHNWMCPGAVIGRYAGRIGASKFVLNDKKYKLKKNWPGAPYTLHSGSNGFQYRIWDEYDIDEDKGSVTFCMESKDGDQGYPGNLLVKVTYTLTDDNEVKIKYDCISDKDTIINMTNHSYFNLAGHKSGSALDHMVKINAEEVVALDKNMLPTGEIKSVTCSPLDFTKWKTVRQDFEKEQTGLSFFTGYDNCYVNSGNRGIMNKVAEVKEISTGRYMEVYTDMPGMQFYSANAIERKLVGKDGAHYREGDALCFETQFLTDAINHDNFGSPIIKAGERFESETVYKFSVF